MKEIKLTQDQITFVDDEDFEGLNQFKWYAAYDRSNQSFRAQRETKIDSTRTTLVMARIIMDCPDELVVDHRNHNTLDNQKGNLRCCTRRQNMYNCKGYKRISKYKGVWPSRGKWAATITVENVFGNSFQKYLGAYENEVDAAVVYDEAAKYYHEEFAYLNFPEGVSNER